MALLLSIDYKGFEVEYWKVIKAQEDYTRGETSIVVGLYKDKEARSKDVNNFLDSKPFVLEGTGLDRAMMYPILKQLEDFKGAEDC